MKKLWIFASTFAKRSLRSMENKLAMGDFFVGDKVTKVRGYKYPGVIVARFTTQAGELRYVVEATGEDYKGMLHIFNGDQLAIEEK